MGESPEVAAVRGASEVWGALLNATLANLAVFIPVLFIHEEAGQLFRDIAIAISAAVALSMLVAVAVVPTAAMRILKRHATRSNTPTTNKTAPASSALAGRARHALAADRTVAGGVRRGRALDGRVDLLGANRALQRGVMPRLMLVGLVIAGSCVATWLLLPKVEYLPGGNRNLVIGILLPPPGYNLDQLLAMGTTVEEGLRPYWDVDPERPAGARSWTARRSTTSSSSPATGRCSSACARPIRCGPPSWCRSSSSLADKLPGTFLVAKQTSLFEQGLTAGRTIDIEITGPDIEQLVASWADGMFGQHRKG